MNVIKHFILYSRLHTVIGTTLSITALYIIAIAVSPIPIDLRITKFILTLISCLGANIYIVGLNQITDIEIDKINKPYLPLASGAYTLQTAYIINTIALLLSISIAFYMGKYLMITVFSSIFLGTIYSMPPLRLKRYHFWAAFCIIAVRGILVNIFLFLHFHTLLLGFSQLPYQIILLTGCIFIYSLVIAWFKDIPDVEGDNKFRIHTLTISSGARNVFFIGNTLLLLNIMTLIILVWTLPIALNQYIFTVVHVLMIIAMFYFIKKTDLKNKVSISKYYQFIWVLFFMEYICFAACAYLI